MIETNIQCARCNNGIKLENRIACPVCKTDTHLLDLNNPMDAFIASGGFDTAMTQACESLHETVIQNLKEVS